MLNALQPLVPSRVQKSKEVLESANGTERIATMWRNLVIIAKYFKLQNCQQLNRIP